MNDICHPPEAESFAECMGVTDGPDLLDDECEKCGGTGIIEPESGDPILDKPYPCDCATATPTKLDLQLRIDRLRATVKPLQDELDATERQLLEVISPFKVGEMIEWDSGKTTARGRVVDIVRGYSSTTCRWITQRIRKDGSDGERVEVHNWKKPRKAE